MFNRSISVPVLSAMAIIAPLYAQPNAPGDFLVERVFGLKGVMAATAPNLPDAVLAGLQSGAIEIHQRFTYNSAQRTMEQLAFILPVGAPVPFPDASSAPVADHYIVQIESASIVSTPRPSLILAGHAISNDRPTPFGDITGAGVTLTIGYPVAGASVQFGPILESVSPLYGLYSDTGAGSLSLTPSPQKCGLSALNGQYIFTLGGFVQSGSGFAPYAESGTFIADGNGILTILDSGNIAGTAFVNRTIPMTYVMNDNCTGRFSWGSNSMDFQLSRDGKSLYMAFTKPSGVIANGSAMRQ